MSKLVVTVTSTLDGFAAGEGGDVFAMPIDPGSDHYNLERMRGARALLVGATTFQGMRDYWPGVAEDPSAPEVERTISRLFDTIPKVVVSDSTTAAGTDPWRDTTEVVGRAAAPGRVAELRRGEGLDVVCFGSPTTWNALLGRGLVDELHVVVGPGVLGSGLPTFAGRVEGRLTLLDARRLEDSQMAVLRYAVDGPQELDRR